MRILAVLLAVAACGPTASEDSPSCEGTCDGGSAAAAQPLRDHLLANLFAQMERGTVMFGQQRFNITGVKADGTQWLATEGAVARSDANTVAGKHPVVMGFDAWDLAIKPETWAPTPAVHAEAAKYVFAQGGIVVMDWHIRGCAATTSFGGAGNEQCLCKLANDDTYARSWLIEQNYKLFADALVRHGLDRVPILFRPFHEMDGNWFWWGKPYWSCAGAITGGAAFQKLYRMIVDYLRVERGLSNLLFGYSMDRTAGFAASYPGDAYVDVLGLDLYYQASPTFADQTKAFRSELSSLASLAYAHGKAAALTEVGNRQIATDPTPWYTEHLLPLLQDARVAYALTWENRRNASDEFWLPFEGHRGVPDFTAFEHDANTLFLDDVSGLYAPPVDGYPMCARCDSDSDGDRWGWEHEASCRVGSWCLR